MRELLTTPFGVFLIIGIVVLVVFVLSLLPTVRRAKKARDAIGDQHRYWLQRPYKAPATADRPEEEPLTEPQKAVG